MSVGMINKKIGESDIWSNLFPSEAWNNENKLQSRCCDWFFHKVHLIPMKYECPWPTFYQLKWSIWPKIPPFTCTFFPNLSLYMVNATQHYIIVSCGVGTLQLKPCRSSLVTHPSHGTQLLISFQDWSHSDPSDHQASSLNSPLLPSWIIQPWLPYHKPTYFLSFCSLSHHSPSPKHP